MKIKVILLISMMLLGSLFASAAVPGTINYQGSVADSAGVPLDGNYNVNFAIYDVAAGGVALWSELQTLTIVNGLFSANLGDVNTLNLPFDSQYYLAISIDGAVEMDPRQRLNSVPYSFKASVADQVVAGSITSASLAPGAVTSAAIAPGAVTADMLGISCPVGAVLITTATGWNCGAVASACSPGDYISCYSGPAGSDGVGECKAGIRSCVSGTLGACSEVLPGTEVCDGLDNNCDGSIDEGGVCTVVIDADQDGYPVGVDCDDTNAAIHPGAVEVCDGLDNDCDGATDVGAVDATVWYQDGDGDGYGNANAASITACSAPQGYVSSGGDCDDTTALVYPGGVELCDSIDNNCNGLVDDACTDRYCNDQDLAIFYGMLSSGESTPLMTGGNVFSSSTCYYGLLGLITDPALAVSLGIGFPAEYGCFTDPATNPFIAGNAFPTLEEAYAAHCPSLYENAFGACVAGQTRIMGSNVGACSPGMQQCHPTGLWEFGISDPAYAGPATEICDGIDNDCDGAVDEGTDQPAYADMDGDGYYPAAAGQMAPVGTAVCTAGAYVLPAGGAIQQGDCDDSNAAVNHGAAEICDGIDNNCDGQVDEPESLVGGQTWYIDADGDGYGDPGQPVMLCGQQPGYVDNALDCDDSDPNINPAVPEVCGNGIDDDCDAVVDELTCI